MKRRQFITALSCLSLLSVPGLLGAAPIADLKNVHPIRLADLFALVERWDLRVDVVRMSPQALHRMSELLKTPLLTTHGSEPSFEYWNAVLTSDPQCKDDEVRMQASVKHSGVERYERFEFSWDRYDEGVRTVLASPETVTPTTPSLQGEVVRTRFLIQEDLCRRFGCVIPDEVRDTALWHVLLNSDPQRIERSFCNISRNIQDFAVKKNHEVLSRHLLSYATYRGIMASKGQPLPAPSQEVLDLVAHNMMAGGAFPYVDHYYYFTLPDGSTVFRGVKSLFSYYERLGFTASV